MSTINDYEELHIYCIDKLNENVGHVRTNFLTACLHADSQNFAIIKPALIAIKAKYPLKRAPLNESA